MKFRLISKHADAIGLGYKLSREGHDVSFWVKDADAKSSYKGMLRQVSDYKDGLTDDTIILFDMVGLGALAEQLGKHYTVFGAGNINDSLELNREFGMKVAAICGLKVPALSNKSPLLTYVGSGDMADMLDYYESVWKGKVDFILQQRISGVEISIEMFFYKGKPLQSTLNSTIEMKKFLDGDRGPNTGCMGSVVRFWKKTEPKLYRLTLRKVLPFLKRFEYTGALDCNCIVNEADKMPYFLEWTARFGYNAIYALCEGLGIDLGTFLHGVSHGALDFRPSYDWLGALRISIPPYPNDIDAKSTAGQPVDYPEDEHFWPLDVKYENRPVTAGVDGVVCEVTGKAKTLAELEGQLYARAESVKVPNKQYRNDIIQRARERLEKLRDWKYDWTNIE